MSESDSVGVLSRQNRGSRRAASTGVVKLREPHTAGSQRVEYGRGDLASVSTQIAEAKIICQYVEDVWLLCRVDKVGDSKKDHR